MESFGHQGRLEDERMLKGAGRYVSDWSLPKQSYGHFLRSDRPHAEIVAIDAQAALSMPGVVAVLTGEELAKAGLQPIPAAAPFKWRDGSEQRQALRPSLAHGRVRHVGEPVEEICRLAKELAVDLVVLGHNQNTSFAARWWKGSVGASILDYAPCSLLVALSRKT